MAKLFHLKEIHNWENAKSGLNPAENYTLQTVGPRLFPLGHNLVDEFTLWTIARQVENEKKSPHSK
jgi:hypothetical protein